MENMFGYWGFCFCERCGAKLITEAGYHDQCEECEHLSDEELEQMSD